MRFKFFISNLIDAKKKTLFLDLDETLIHTCQLKQNPEHVVLLPIENGNKISVYKIRLSYMNFVLLMDRLALMSDLIV